MTITTKHVSDSPVTVVTHERFPAIMMRKLSNDKKSRQHVCCVRAAVPLWFCGVWHGVKNPGLKCFRPAASLGSESKAVLKVFKVYLRLMHSQKGVNYIAWRLLYYSTDHTAKEALNRTLKQTFSLRLTVNRRREKLKSNKLGSAAQEYY